jgi:hypothetical protein
VSFSGRSRLWIKATVLVAFAVLFFAFSVRAQYPGQITKPETNAPDLRAIAVFEWTGEEAHPKNGRLVPICVYDGQDLNDAGVYLSRPEPLALQSDVEYQLQHDGIPAGLFDIDTSAREQGGWVGYGKWLPMPAAKAAPTQVAKVDAEDDAQSDVPILHRKHHAGDSGAGNSGGASAGGSGASSGSGSGSGASAPDPDQPTLHKGGDASTTGAGSGSGSGSNSGSNSGSDSNAPPSDPDRPVLRRTDNNSSTNNGAGNGSDNGSGSNSGSNSGSPKLKKKKKDSDEGHVDSVANAGDPDRPHLFYGKPSGYGVPVLPTLFGVPPDMRQTIAVSDSTDRPEHPWNYTWANPDDEDKMKSAMEDQARIALGLEAAPTAKSKTAISKTAAAHKSAKPAAVPPAPLLVEQFRVFELAYGSGATMVLSAHTMATGDREKFVTLIGQPDLYGGVAVLMKNVTDAAHLDLMPRMRLVDAVDAEADNRGELMFELRGATERQFALYRVLRGDARQIFLSGPQSFALAAAN